MTKSYESEELNGSEELKLDLLKSFMDLNGHFEKLMLNESRTQVWMLVMTRKIVEIIQEQPEPDKALQHFIDSLKHHMKKIK